MSEEKAVATHNAGSIIEQVLMKGDLAALSPVERVNYYNAVCQSVGVNPLTRPFEYIELNGKLVLYATRNCTDQLREGRHINVTIVSRDRIEDAYVVTARATMPDGRTDESVGAVSLVKEDGEWKTSQNGRRYFQGNGEWKSLRGDDLANALMKAETKSKRRVTLSIVGLSLLDETEIESIPNARPVVDVERVPEVQRPQIAEPTTIPTDGPEIDDDYLLERWAHWWSECDRLEIPSTIRHGFPAGGPLNAKKVAVSKLRKLVERFQQGEPEDVPFPLESVG